MTISADKRIICISGSLSLRASKISAVDLRINSTVKRLKIWMNGNEVPFELTELDDIMSFCTQYKDYLKCIGCTAWEDLPSAN